MSLRSDESGGLCLLDEETIEHPVKKCYTTKDGLGSNWIRNMLETSDGQMWLATVPGLCRWQGEGSGSVCKTYSAINDLCDDILALAEDKDGNLWTGSPCGAKKIARYGFTTYDKTDGLYYDQANSIFENSSGELFAEAFPKRQRVISRFDGDKFSPMKLLLRPYVDYHGWGWQQTVWQDSVGAWWIPTEYGILRSPDNTSFEDLEHAPLKKIDPGGKEAEVFRLFEDSRGDIWMLTTGASNELLRHGVTSFHDASAGNTLEDFALFQQLRNNGILQSRATVMIGSDALPQLVEAGLAPFSGDEHVRLGSVKIMLHEGGGEMYPPLDELNERVWQAHRQGFQVALHAVEEGPICAALEAIGAALQRQPRADHRHRIEHCALCPPPFIEKLVETGTAVVMQPGFLHFYGEKYRAEVVPELYDWLYRTKSLLAAGVPVAGSSDCPIAPLSPLVSLQAAMTRKTREGVPLNPQEQLPLNDALTLFTSAGAWLSFEESYKGKIMPGTLADLAVLDGDLMRTPAEEVNQMKVAMTIVGGEIKFKV